MGLGMPINQSPIAMKTPYAELISTCLKNICLGVQRRAVGFGGVAVAFAGLAKIIFFVFLVLLIVSLVTHVRA